MAGLGITPTSGLSTAQPVDNNPILAVTNRLANGGNVLGNVTPGPAAATWDTGLDAGVGAIDAQIRQYGAYQGNAALYDPKQAAALQQQRTTANAARWQSANLAGSPARDQIAKLLASGQLTYQDLGSIDITTISDDAKLGSAVQDLLAKKALPPPGTAPVAGPAPVDQAATDAQSSVSGILDNVTKFANDALDPNNPDSSLGIFDKKAQSTMGQISSAATTYSHHAGGALAGSVANSAGTSAAANNAAGRDLVAKDSMARVNDYVNKTLSDDMNMQKDVTTMDAGAKLDLQKHTANALVDELRHSIGTGNANASAQIDTLESSIKHWQTLDANSKESHDEWMKILGLGAGILMAGTGAALTATGAGAVPGALLMAGGGAQIARSA